MTQETSLLIENASEQQRGSTVWLRGLAPRHFRPRLTTTRTLPGSARLRIGNPGNPEAIKEGLPTNRNLFGIISD